MSNLSSPTLRNASFRSVTARLGQRLIKRADRELVDRNTSPTDFVLRDYRNVR